ncbi:unnamed protein product [Symbiodinium sp. CCMP2592]|nr:unnamed protein product [Symbiodinium sp. CCMP2592]
MTTRMDARASGDEQVLGQRLDQVRELEHHHRSVLSRYPSAQFLLPNPHDDHPSRDPWQRRVHGADTLLVSLEAPDPARLRNDARRVYAEILEEEEYLLDDLPEETSFEHNSSAWIITFLGKLRVIDAVAGIKDINRSVPAGGHATHTVVTHRQTALRLLVAIHATTFETHPTFHRLLPFADDETISKRAWERQLYVIRSLLRLVERCDRTGSHNFILGYYVDTLRWHPALRDALPDPAEEDKALDEWARVVLAAVHSIMTAD